MEVMLICRFNFMGEILCFCLSDIAEIYFFNTESGTKGHKTRLIACLSTLYLFCKIKPELLVNHTITIHPYLNIKCNVSIFRFSELRENVIFGHFIQLF